MIGALRLARSHGVVAVALSILAGCGQKGPLMLPGDADPPRGAPASVGTAGGGEGTGEPGRDEDEARRDGRRDGR